MTERTGTYGPKAASRVTGKAQKYTKMGPREFVPFEDDKDFSLEKIKFACEEHFAPVVGTDVPGEQGPSCKSIEHIPDQKLFTSDFRSSIPDKSIELEKLISESS